MENVGYTQGSTNDSWNGYTQYEHAGREFEVRHPRAPFTSGFSLWRWNKLTGWVLLTNKPTLQEAETAIQTY